MFVRTFVLTNAIHLLVTDSVRSFVSLFVSFSFSRVFRDYFSIAISAQILVLVFFRSFIGIRQFKRLDLRIEALFLFNQLEQDFGTVKFDFSPD